LGSTAASSLFNRFANVVMLSPSLDISPNTQGNGEPLQIRPFSALAMAGLPNGCKVF